MRPPTLTRDWDAFVTQIKRLEDLSASLLPLNPVHRWLVAEILMIRLFMLVENCIEVIAAKLLCGAQYLDATAPHRIVFPSSLQHALRLMETHSRPKPRLLRWNKAKEIRENLATTLDLSDPLFAAVAAVTMMLNDMRYVRNHIAHNNAGTRNRFQTVVLRHYGARVRAVTPGRLLLTQRPGPAPVLNAYLIAAKTFVKAVVHA